METRFVKKGDPMSPIYSDNNLTTLSSIPLDIATLERLFSSADWKDPNAESGMFSEKHGDFLSKLSKLCNGYPSGFLFKVVNLQLKAIEGEEDLENIETFILDIALLYSAVITGKPKPTKQAIELYEKISRSIILTHLFKEYEFFDCELPEEIVEDKLSILNLEENKLMKVNGEIVQVKNIMEDDATKTKVLVPVRFKERYLPKGAESITEITDKWKDVNKAVYKDLITGLGKFDHLKHRVPNIDQTFLLNRPEYMDFIKLFIKPGFSKIILSGDAGVGKSELVQQVCARMNMPLARVDFSGEVIAEQILWGTNYNPEKQRMEVVEGIIPYCVRNGVKLCLEEFSAIPPSVAFELHRLFENGQLYIKDNDTLIEPHPNFSIIATDNRIGNPNFQRYFGTQQQNSALISRLNSCIWIPYPKKQLEMAYLSLKFPEVDNLVVDNKDNLGTAKKVLELIVDFANDVRSKYVEGQLAFTISPRDIVSFFENLYELEDLNKAFDYSILNFHRGFSSDEQAISNLFEKYFGKGSKLVNSKNVVKVKKINGDSLIKLYV